MNMPIDLTDIIDDTARELGIPQEYWDGLRLEGQRAFIEGRDIREALRYWYEGQ